MVRVVSCLVLESVEATRYHADEFFCGGHSEFQDDFLEEEIQEEVVNEKVIIGKAIVCKKGF